MTSAVDWPPRLIEHHRANVERRMETLEKKFSLLNLKTGTGIFTFSVPGLVTAASAALNHNPAVMIGGGALVLAGIAANAALERWLAKADASGIVCPFHAQTAQAKRVCGRAD
jgi:hypothetical protein